jgi:hypothetical protein
MYDTRTPFNVSGDEEMRKFAKQHDAKGRDQWALFFVGNCVRLAMLCLPFLPMASSCQSGRQEYQYIRQDMIVM